MKPRTIYSDSLLLEVVSDNVKCYGFPDLNEGSICLTCPIEKFCKTQGLQIRAIKFFQRKNAQAAQSYQAKVISDKREKRMGSDEDLESILKYAYSEYRNVRDIGN